MKDIILVGGMPYSGKSHLCKQIADKDPRYVNLCFDTLCDEMNTDAEKFVNYTNMYNPKIISQVKTDNGPDPKAVQDKIRNALNNSGQGEHWQLFLQGAAMACLTEKLMSIGDSTPVMESLYYNKEDRQSFYDSLKDHIAILNSQREKQLNPDDLDSVKKKLIFFDYDLDFVLDRYRNDGSERPLVNEGAIRLIHDMQSIPSDDELPNLEVIIVKDPQQTSEILAKL